MTEIAKIQHCGVSGKGVVFPIDANHTREILGADRANTRTYQELLARNPMLARRLSINETGVTINFDFERPALLKLICGFNSEDLSEIYKSPFLLPIYVIGGFLVLHFLYKQCKSKETLTAHRLIKLIMKDFEAGRFRNGLREEDIFRRYQSRIDYYQAPFEEEVLPTVSKALDDDPRIQKQVQRAGHSVWVLAH